MRFIKLLCSIVVVVLFAVLLGTRMLAKPEIFEVTLVDCGGEGERVCTPVDAEDAASGGATCDRGLSVTARDTCDPHVASRIVSVVSNESGARGAGKPSASDWEITGPLTLLLSAERAGTGTGRDYTITIEAADTAGNRTSMPVIVRIPHN